MGGAGHSEAGLAIGPGNFPESTTQVPPPPVWHETASDQLPCPNRSDTVVPQIP
jgi:hypothetical protein